MRIKPSARPETYSSLVVRSVKLYWQVLPRTFIFALLVSIIIFIPRLMGIVTRQNSVLAGAGVNQLLYVAIYISGLWFLATILWCINCIERNKHKSFIVDFEMAGKRMLYVVGAAICLFLIGVVVGMIAYLLYSLFLFLHLYSLNRYITACLLFLVFAAQIGISVAISALFYFYFPLIVIEHDGIVLALKQSAQLVWNKIGMTIQLQLTPWFVYFLVLLGIKMLFKVNINIYFMPLEPVNHFYPTVLHILVLAFFVPWGSAMMLVQLHDLELRKAAALRKK